MKAITIYHNSRCSKSNQALNYLKEKGLENQLNIVKYLDNTVDRKTAKEIANYFKDDLPALIRKDDAKKLGVEIPEKLTIEWVAESIVNYPKIMQRPIVIKNGKAVIARPTEKIDDLV